MLNKPTDIALKPTILNSVDIQIQNECFLIIDDLRDCEVFYPKNVDTPLFSLEIDFQKRYLVLKFFVLDGKEATFLFSMSPYIRLIREYRQICRAYKEALIQSHASAIETIDMARRGLHNQAADLMEERMSEKINLDQKVCRYLFSIMALLVSVK